MSEKIDTSVNCEITWRIANVPMIEKMPTASGSSAATIEPNTQISSTSVIGIAIISASRRSSSMVRVTSALTTARPPALIGHRVAADAGLLERVHEIVSSLDRLGVGPGDMRHHERSVPSAAAQWWSVLQRPVRHRDVDVLEATDELGDLGARGARRLAVDVAVGGRHHEHDVGLLLAELLLEGIGCSHGFGACGVEPAGDQVLGHPAAERGSGDREDENPDEGEPAAPDDERAESSKHGLKGFP